MDLTISYPFKPYDVTQKWGQSTTAYSTQFNDPNFTLHNGIDANVGGRPVTGWQVYCPVAGFKVEWIDYQPNGGGNEIYLISKEKVQMFDQLCYARVILCHAEKILVNVGDEPALGELLMIADNTGFSTGPHTHMGLYRLGDNRMKLDSNQATGSFDPSLFFDGTFAIDRASLATLIKSNLRYYRYRLGA